MQAPAIGVHGWRWVTLSVLLVVLGTAQHCPQGPFVVNCGSTACATGFWIGGQLKPTLELATGCSYSFQIGGGGGFIITNSQRSTSIGGVGGAGQHATSGTVTWTPQQPGNYFYINDANTEYRGFINVVTDGDWSGFGCCTNQAGCSGTQSRSCTSPSPVNTNDFLTGVVVQGAQCAGSDTQNCPGACTLVWSQWSSCSGSNYRTGVDPGLVPGGECGFGQRTRSCPTGCGGCDGMTGTQSEACSANGGVCPGGWSNWGSCSCGFPTGSRTRACNNPPVVGAGAPCPGSATDNTCFSARCAGHNCGYENSCPSCTCTPGNCTRIASCNCDHPADDNLGACVNHGNRTAGTCNLGSFGWSAWTQCPCSFPTSDNACTNTRTCSRPASADCNGINFCPGPNSRANTTRLCPPRYWSDWGPCSAPLCRQGGGTRTRDCVNTGGADCVGLPSEPCNLDPCNGEWSAWGSCSRDCGGGVASRKCKGSVNGGVNCTALGSPYQFEGPCNTHGCGCILDMCFALDGSASIPQLSWQQLKDFSTTLLDQINAGNGTEAAIVQFSDSFTTRVEQSMTSSLPTLKNVIIGLVQQRGATAIGQGINKCEFQLETYDRPLIANVMLVITDGTQNDGPSAIQEANKAKANGTEVFVIGVGGDVNYTELYNLASEPKIGVHLFNISDYSALSAIADQVTQGLCFGRPQPAAPINFYPFLALLAVVPLAFATCVVVRRRRKPKKKVVPPPTVVEEEPPPPPTVKTASPKPITDKPKDWTVPGTRYIGFGQANIKVKWGTEAPPSAPRGHDKYDRWSMMAHPDGMKPAGSPTTEPLNVDSEAAAAGSGTPGSPAAASARKIGCCERLFPCCCRPTALNQTKAKTAPSPKKKKGTDDDDEADWQTNPAAQ